MDDIRTSEYRQRVYDKYISEMIHPDGIASIRLDYFTCCHVSPGGYERASSN